MPKNKSKPLAMLLTAQKVTFDKKKRLMITVIIPTLNEEENIASVVNFAKCQQHVTELIVVDDKSLHKTVSIAEENRAKVITSTKLGKGAS